MTALPHEKEFSRKTFLKGGGALIVGFSLASAGVGASAASASLGGPWPSVPLTSLDSWLRVGQDGKVTVFTSNPDSTGQGVITAFAQIVADELDAAFASVTVVAGDTAVAPDHGGQGAAQGVIVRSQPLRYAAAEARLALLNLASARFGVPVAQLSVSNGLVSVTTNPSQKATYGELVGGRLFNVALKPTDFGASLGYKVPNASDTTAYATGQAQLKTASQYKVIGQSIPRVDIPGKVTGKDNYVQNLHLPSMVHARLVVPPSPSANLVRINGFKGAKPPGLIKVVAQGNLVAVVTEQEWAAIQASQTLDAVWTDAQPSLTGVGNVYGSLRTQPPVIPAITTWQSFATKAVGAMSNPNRGDVNSALRGATKALQADYNYPMQGHGQLGPAASVADVRDGQAIVWSPTGHIGAMRSAVAETLRLPESNVRIIATEGSGNYGRNTIGALGGEEDTGVIAAFLSQAVGRPVRLTLLRDQDFLTDAYGLPMSIQLRGGVDGQGNVVAWSTELWTWAVNPKTEWQTLFALLTGTAAKNSDPFFAQGIHSLGGGDLSTYEFPNESFVTHQIAPQLRVGGYNLRSPKRIQMNFAVESFIDELAAAAGADPIAFRLQQLQNSQKVASVASPTFDLANYKRTIGALEALRSAMKWQTRPAPGARNKSAVVSGRGVAAMGNYTNVFGGLGAEVEVNKKTGRVRVTRLVNAVDAGLIINPRSARNVVQQGVIFALSRALHEQVKFDRKTILSKDWVSYPILRFVDVPDQEIVMIDRPEYWGGGLGEGNEIMVPAVIGNAIFDATGVRIREVPFTPKRVREALKTAGVT
jgi:CO/xanthine dehydrogenase Mo-binding subunit